MKRSFNSFPVAADTSQTGLYLVNASTFNSFPVAAGEDAGGEEARARLAFNSFPVAASGLLQDHGLVAGGEAGLSILSQLQLGKVLWEDTVTVPLATFNSFPVAAETLAAYSLINFSSANFEVRENSLALPPDACMDSCKPFPDSRRKEGIWRERNDA